MKIFILILILFLNSCSIFNKDNNFRPSFNTPYYPKYNYQDCQLSNKIQIIIINDQILDEKGQIMLDQRKSVTFDGFMEKSYREFNSGF